METEVQEQNLNRIISAAKTVNHNIVIIIYPRDTTTEINPNIVTTKRTNKKDRFSPGSVTSGKGTIQGNQGNERARKCSTLPAIL